MPEARLLFPTTPVAWSSLVCGRLLWGLGSFAAWMSLGACGLLVLTLCGGGVGLHWNLTDSVPPGLYRRTREPLVRGRLIVFCLPLATAQFGGLRRYIQQVPNWSWVRECASGYQPLLKPIAALAGDVVELAADSVRINDTRVPDSATHVQDRHGRVLPHMPWGRYQIAEGDLWVMSTMHPNSWDSRYFGPIAAASVIATAAPLWVWPTAEAHP